MKITLESTVYKEGVKATIETSSDDMLLDSVIEQLIKPVLVAYGFHANSVEDCFRNE